MERNNWLSHSLEDNFLLNNVNDQGDNDLENYLAEATNQIPTAEKRGNQENHIVNNLELLEYNVNDLEENHISINLDNHIDFNDIPMADLEAAFGDTIQEPNLDEGFGPQEGQFGGGNSSDGRVHGDGRANLVEYNVNDLEENHFGGGNSSDGRVHGDGRANGHPGGIPPPNQPNKPRRNEKCGACKSRGAKCPPDCPFRPYFTPEQTVEWGKISRVFGYQNICTMMEDVPMIERGDFFKNKIEEADIIWKHKVQGYSHVTNKLKAKIAQKDEEMKNKLAEKDREIAALRQTLHQMENQGNRQH